ncbi:MAG: DEAD/DEAH box helicase family protein [Gemmataceae bacterium]|nr:DEAD/DEAH box helicase family protein [Gemmataceae bacterium]
MSTLYRPYQADAVRLTLGAIDGGLDPLVSMATGLGKTPVMAAVGAEVARRTGRRVGFLVPRRELGVQLEGWLERVDPGAGVGWEQADRRAGRGQKQTRYVVATVQSISRKGRLDQFDPVAFGLWLVDEGHHAHAQTYQRVRDHFRQNPACRWGGFSATWTDGRGDGMGLSAGFNTVAYRYPTLSAIRDGWLVSPKTWPMTVTGIDWGSVPTDGYGNYVASAVEELLLQEGPFHKLALAVRERCGGRPAVVYGPGKRWVMAAKAVWDRYEPGNVRGLTDDTLDADRAAIFSDFEGGLFTKLVNCGIVTEGIDLPRCAAVAICRPCQSQVLAAQIVGRCLRPEAGLLDAPERRDRVWQDRDERLRLIARSGKPDALVLDFCSPGARKLLTTADLLGADLPEPVRDYANRLLRQQADEAAEDGAEPGPQEVEAVLERAEAEWALIQEEVARRAGLTARSVRYETREVDLFDPRERPTPVKAGVAQHDPPTDKQVGYIVGWLGWSEAKAKNLSRRAASGIIAKHRAGKIQPRR